MSGLPTPFSLGVKRRQVGAKDAHGKPTVTYAAATPWAVHGYAPGATGPGMQTDPNRANRDLSLILWTIFAPDSADAPTEHDLVVLEGDEYAVENRPADWTNGPWPHPTAGLVVELKRAEG